MNFVILSSNLLHSQITRHTIASMPHHCAVPGCTSNSKTTVEVSFHNFPTDTDICRVWVRNIRSNGCKEAWQINSSTCVCSLHFMEHSYDGASRKRERKNTRRSRMLKLGTVSTVFDCLSLPPPSEKHLLCTVSSHQSNPNMVLLSQRMPAASKHLQLPQMPMITLLSGYR